MSRDSRRTIHGAVVAERRPLTEETFLLTLAPGGEEPLPLFAPGQFFQLSCPGGGEAPFSPLTAPAAGDPLTFCIRRVGHVTSLLHRCRPGDTVALRGPFGRGFPLERLAGRPLLVMAGGLGIVPLRSLLESLARERNRYGPITLFYGAREPAQLLFAAELLALGQGCDIRVRLTADLVDEEALPAFACRTGLVHELLLAEGMPLAGSSAVLCGPPALFRCLVPLLTEAGIAAGDIFLSLERRMECGQGRCCHCGVGSYLCCTDGPVFSWAELADVEDAL
jgi:NAD(P)H-flavin reductase